MTINPSTGFIFKNPRIDFKNGTLRFYFRIHDEKLKLIDQTIFIIKLLDFIEKLNSEECTILKETGALNQRNKNGYFWHLLTNGFSFNLYSKHFDINYLTESFEKDCIREFEEKIKLIHLHPLTIQQLKKDIYENKKLEIVEGKRELEALANTEYVDQILAILLASNSILKSILKQMVDEISLEKRVAYKQSIDEITEIITGLGDSVLNQLLSSKRKLNFEKTIARHEFVISRTKELDNFQFGKLGERALFKHLKRTISNDQQIKKLLDLENYPLIETYCKIDWLNEKQESGNPYDLLLKLVLGYKKYSSTYSSLVVLKQFEINIEVKTTRVNEDAIFYLSLKECSYMTMFPNSYIIARLCFIDSSSYNGIQIHDEFYVNYYKPKKELIDTIKSKYEEWRDHYSATEIRFTIDHFDLIE